MPHALQIAVLLVFPALVLLGGLRDLSSYTIPNWISLALLGAFPLAVLVSGAPLGAAGMNLTCALAALVLGMAMFALRWVGGGDAKLFAAAALWLGWPAATTYILVICLAGGFLTLVLLALRSAWLRPLVLSGPGWFVRLAEPEEAVPYGAAIAAGALAAFPTSVLTKGLALPF